MLEVVMLHNVKERISRTVGPIADYAVTGEQLESFILERQHWDAISSDELESLSWKKNSFLLTFDDGYHDNISVALPILEKYNIPCIIFCTPGFISREVYPYELELADVIEDHQCLTVNDQNLKYFIGKLPAKKNLYNNLRLPLKSKSYSEREHFMDSIAAFNNYNRSDYQNESFLSWDDINELNKRPLVTIGAHTIHHEQLTKQSFSKAFKEILDSKQAIEKKINEGINHFSYPYGSNNIITQLLLRLAGFKFGYTTVGKKIDRIGLFDKTKMPRIDIINLL